MHKPLDATDADIGRDSRCHRVSIPLRDQKRLRSLEGVDLLLYPFGEVMVNRRLLLFNSRYYRVNEDKPTSSTALGKAFNVGALENT